MIDLSATLLVDQKGAGVTGAAYEQLWKVVLSLSGQTTRGYDRSRVLQIQHTEEEDNGVAEVLLQNSDLAIDSTVSADNFEQYQGIIHYGYHTGISRSAWVKNTAYKAYVKGVSAADVVIPTTVNGYQYKCVVAGSSHATTQPTWPTDLGVRVTDGTVTWEMDGNAGDEYTPRAPLRVEGQEFISSETQLICRLYLTGIPNDMAGDEAEDDYEVEDTDTNTCKDLISAIAGATLDPYTNYTGYTVTYDGEDSLIDSFKPKDYFSVNINENRDDKIQELLNYTGCKRRAEADGAIHVLVPITDYTSILYDYEYRLLVDTYHTFFAKALRNRFVNPNKEVVRTPGEIQPQYEGDATSATSYALKKKIHTTQLRVTSSAQCTSIAEAKIGQYELNAERGSIKAPLNCGQEIWDYIKVTDARNDDSRVGNVQYIQFNCKSPEIDGSGDFSMNIRFGRVNTQTIGAVASGKYISEGAGIPQWLIDYINDMLDDIKTLYSNQNIMIDNAISLREKLNELINYINRGVVPKWHITTEARAPVDDR